MNRVASIFTWVAVFLCISACVEPIVFDTPPPRDLVIVDGSITDEPGPYTVKVSRGLRLSSDSSVHAPVAGVKIRLHDDEGAVEDLFESKEGEYKTRGVIRGRVGHSYYITLELPDGTTFESEPEKILPAGELTSIRHEFEARNSVKDFGSVQADVFNVYIDANAAPENKESNEVSYIRWRFTGTYRVDTRPELHLTFLQVSAYMTPYPCSGYVVEPALGGGKLVQREPCVCCTCWVKQYETSPQLSDTELVSDGQFRNVKVGEVPITDKTFHRKFLMEVEQMAISKTAFDFFKIVRTQKESASDLFQPPSGRLTGNIKAADPSYPVVGLFWAASVRRKSAYVEPSDIPYPVRAIEVIAEPCNIYFANSSLTKPANWND